jgi:hypothetical protein
MSDIQEEQKRLYKRAEENDIRLLQEENNRLNNIIDELEKWLKEQVFNKAGNSVDLAIENHSYCKVLDKLNELKGDNK